MRLDHLLSKETESVGENPMDVSLEEYDMQGRMMLSLKPNDSDQVNVQLLPAGVYIIVITDKSGQTSGTRFVK